MDETTFRIIDLLSRDLSSAISINELTNRIKEVYGTAHYKNIFDKIKELQKKKIINLFSAGKASIISLNFNNNLITDLLAEMEFKRKKDFIENKISFQNLFMDIEREFRRTFPYIESISIIEPEKNSKLNRAEFLFILEEPSKWWIDNKPENPEIGEKQIQSEILGINSIMEHLMEMHNMKIDCLILRKNEFIELFKANELNPLQEMLANKIAFFSPQEFWLTVNEIILSGVEIKTQETIIKPDKINEEELIYNLYRFGYKEIGKEVKEEKNICIETIISGILLLDNKRRIEAIPVILAKEFRKQKSRKPIYNLIIFLCRKYNKLEKLFGLLKTFNKLKPIKETGNAIKILESLNIKEIKADEKAMKQKMRLYNAI